MTGPAGFLEFFILEASDYVEQLDGVLLRGGSQGPDADQLQRIARALRGTATMARIPSFAHVAASVERVGRALRDGSLRWDPGLDGAVVAAVDELKTLLHSARNWSAADDQRAAARVAELSRYAPPRSTPQPQTTSAQQASESAPFLATEASNIAAGLELLGTRSGDAGMAANVLRRVRALRGVAGVKEIVPLADTLEATEDAARGLEAGQPLTGEARQLLATAADYLRTLASALRDGRDTSGDSPTRDAFVVALDRWNERVGERERVVPIAELFYADGTTGIVETSLNPPTSASARFRLELVSQGEHLRQVLDDARHVHDDDSTARARRALRRDLGAMQASALSFGDRDVAAFVGLHLPFTDHIDFLGLTALDDLAALVSGASATGDQLAARMREVVSSHELTRAIGAGFGTVAPASRASGQRNLIDAMSESARAAGAARATPNGSVAASAHESAGRRPLIVDTPVYTDAIPFAPLSAPAAPVAPTRSATPPRPASRETPAAPVPAISPPQLVESLDQTSAALIDSSLLALEAFDANPFTDRVPIPDEVVVSIDALVYRGRAALDRASDIGHALRSGGPATDRAALEELLDLVELARAG